jgi:hypothetical protein
MLPEISSSFHAGYLAHLTPSLASTATTSPSHALYHVPRALRAYALRPDLSHTHTHSIWLSRTSLCISLAFDTPYFRTHGMAESFSPHHTEH